MKSEWPLAGERRLRSVAPGEGSAADGAPPAPSVFERLRHDARSTAHTMQGFLELFGSGTFGALSPMQEQSIGHLKQAAQRMQELLDTAIDLQHPERHADRDELTPVLLSALTSSLVYTLMRDEPQLALSHIAQLRAEQRTVVRRAAFETVLRTLLHVAHEQSGARLTLTLSQSDLHTTLTILAGADEAPESENVSQSLPAHVALTGNLDALAPDLRNRDYLRLKRCEALLERQRGRLLVAPDLSRFRLLLPVQH